MRRGKVRRDVEAWFGSDQESEHRSRVGARLPLAICIPIIAALSLAGWAVVALLLRAVL